MTIRGNGQPIRSLAFGPGGRWLIAAAVDAADRPGPSEWAIWDALTGAVIECRAWQYVRRVAVDPSGTRIAVGSDGPTVALWKVMGDQPLRLVSQPVCIRPTG